MYAGVRVGGGEGGYMGGRQGGQNGPKSGSNGGGQKKIRNIQNLDFLVRYTSNVMIYAQKFDLFGV